MSKRIYVGNLPFSASDDEIRELVGRYGTVESLKIERGDKMSVAILDMSEGGGEVLRRLQGLRFKGSQLEVNEARPRV